jgi:hypothetical protein
MDSKNIVILKKNETTGEIEPISNENVNERTQMNDNFQVKNF